MCGIAGIVYYDQDRAVDPALIENMARAMVHRGPDDGGVYVDGHVGLGHRRLSIIDLAGGHQPMSNKDETVWIVFNGEIYNYRELREELLAKGYTFKTNSDTEVIIHLYEEAEEQCIQRLSGMFSFAIWDKKKQTLFVARDRLGIKPLYFVNGPGFLAFSSEMRALLEIKSIQPQLDLQALHNYLTFRYNIAPETMFKNIQKLLPGYILVARAGRIQVRQYWDIDYSKKIIGSEEEIVDEFHHRLTACTKSHLMSEVPLGVLLSGGLDSTIMTGLVSGLSAAKVKTFSIGFVGENEDIYDERPYARLAAKYFNTDHYEVGITGREFVDGLNQYIWHMEEPMADAAAIPLYYVAKLAKEHVTVILSGEGGDELLAGYMFWLPFKGFNRAQLIKKIPRIVRRYVLSTVNDMIFRSMRAKRYLDLAELPSSHYPFIFPIFVDNVFSEAAKYQLYGESLRRAKRFAPSDESVIESYRKTTNFEFLDQMLYVYTKQWLPDDLLLKADKMTMAHSLELRVPYLDHSLVEFVAAAPVNMKMRKGADNQFITKYMLRKAFDGKVPPEILNRKKLGFHVPLNRLFKDELRTIAEDVFYSQAFRDTGLFDIRKITALLKQHQSGVDMNVKLWCLLVFAMWHERFKVA
jgi:asparagine synthase (glutamine-hydrolysing)